MAHEEEIQQGHVVINVIPGRDLLSIYNDNDPESPPLFLKTKDLRDLIDVAIEIYAKVKAYEERRKIYNEELPL